MLSLAGAAGSSQSPLQFIRFATVLAERFIAAAVACHHCNFPNEFIHRRSRRVRCLPYVLSYLGMLSLWSLVVACRVARIWHHPGCTSGLPLRCDHRCGRSCQSIAPCLPPFRRTTTVAADTALMAQWSLDGAWLVVAWRAPSGNVTGCRSLSFQASPIDATTGEKF